MKKQVLGTLIASSHSTSCTVLAEIALAWLAVPIVVGDVDVLVADVTGDGNSSWIRVSVCVLASMTSIAVAL